MTVEVDVFVVRARSNENSVSVYRGVYPLLDGGLISRDFNHCGSSLRDQYQKEAGYE